MEVTTPAPARLRFGLYELDPDLYELRRDGTLIGLQRQPCRLLYLLASRSGEVVGRDDIRAALWPEERAGEFDVRINFCLARIREALHEDAANPRFIKTVRGRGYCFLAPLREEAAAEPGLPAAGSPPNPAARGGRAVGTVGQVGAEGCEIHPVAARPRQTTRRARPGWGTRGPQPGRAFKRVEWRSHSGPRANQSSDRAGAQGVPSPVERQAGRVAKPLGVPRQSIDGEGAYTDVRDRAGDGEPSRNAAARLLSPRPTPSMRAPWRWMAAGVVAATAAVMLWAWAGERVPANNFQLGAPVTLASSPDSISDAMAVGGGRIFFPVSTPQGARVASMPEGGGSLTLLPIASAMSTVMAASGDGKYLVTRLLQGTTDGSTGYLVRVDGSAAPWRLEAVVQGAAWRPGSGQFAYAGGGRVWLVDPAQHGKRLIATLTQDVTGLAWSADGQRMVVASLDSSQEDTTLWLLRPGGGQPLSLARLRGLSWVYQIAWAGDGDFLILRGSRQRSGGPSLVAVPLRRAGSRLVAGNPRMVQLDGTPGFGGPALDSHGRILISESATWTEVLRYQSASGEWQRLLADARDVAYAPGGRRVAYVQPSDNTLWVRDTGGSPTRELTKLQVMLPSWSPDGKLLAFTALTPGANWRLYLMAPEGGKPEALPDPDPANGQGAPTWLPDGQALIYADTWCGHPKDCGVHRLDLRTRQDTLLPGSEGLRTARVSPDGRWVAALDAVTHNLLLSPLNGGGWRRLWPRTLADYLAWSSDSRFVYGVEVSGGQTAIERVSLDGTMTVAARVHDPVPLEENSMAWFGLGPGNALLVAHEVAGSEVVALPWSSH